MINSLEQSKARYLIPVLSFLLVIAASGCAGPKIAADLLANVDKRDQPLVKNAVAIEVAINPAINNDERIDESVKESLALALANANLFGADPARPYRINARVTVASQAAMSFGSFEGKLEINYVLLDAGNNKIMDETIHTEAGSDTMYFYGPKRHRRARAVNISKNVLQFVAILQTRLGK